MNQYHIYEKIGKGRYSTVYKGRKKKTIQYYAIKSVDKSQKNRVLQEVRVMHALDHKNILKFYAWYETTNHLWLILEYCVGGDLMSLLRQDVRLPESSVHDFARDLVTAMQFLHSNSIIYCDLKPSNILLDENGRLKLGGFGLSRKLADINKKPVKQLPQAMQGTPAYMAPELFSDGGTHSTASDLWSLGCVLYECAAGRPPFMDSSFQQLVHNIINNDPPPITGLSPEFSNLLSRLLDKNPATRLNWGELVEHPFWHIKLADVEMPPEPALEHFIELYKLRPTVEDIRASVQGIKPDKSIVMRQSIDITRLSRIALSNLEREGDGADYSAAEAQPGDIRIDTADAELNFEETKEDVFEDDSAPSPTQSDDGSVIDQGSITPLAEGSRMMGTLDGDAMRAQARSRLGESTTRLPSSKGADAPSTNGRPAANGAVEELMVDDEMQTGIGSGDPAQLERLIWHASDLAVKPIVANRRIERLPEPRYDASTLPFRPMPLQEMMQADQRELEAFLTNIYRAIASAAPLKDKVNVLSYFETLCTDTNAANILINSSLTILFIRMLQNARAPTLRMRLASVLGLLVRHATYIAEELAQTKVVEILGEALKDKNERVRRRVMATLGELLFYIATQQQDAQSTATTKQVSDIWGINSTTFATVLRLLKPQEDDIAQHYAVKTVENICSQGGDWASKFATQDVVSNLLAIYTAGGRTENLQSTTMSTLARLLRQSPPLVTFMVERFGVHVLVAGIADNSSNSKVQTSCLNILNLVLSQPDLSTRAKAALLEERGLVTQLLALLDHAALLLRAKALVSVMLLCRLSVRWLLEACHAKLMPAVERLQREQDEYLQEALGALRQELGRLVPVICQQVSDELSRSSGKRGAPASSPARPPSVSKTNTLTQLTIIMHLITSPVFRPAVVTDQLIQELAGYLRACVGGSSQSLTEFKGTLMHVLEAISKQTDLVIQHHETILQDLLPALCEAVTNTAEGGDMRFLCLRIASDILTTFLLDEELYGSHNGMGAGAQGGHASVGTAVPAIDNVLRANVLPMVPQLLKDEDPMPLYALKLLGGILEVNPQYVRDVEQQGLASQFFDFLSLEHSNNNVHNIRLCRQIIAAGTMPVAQLIELQVAQRVAAVVEYAAQNNVEPFLEPVLGLCCEIINRDCDEVAAGSSQGALMAEFLSQAPVFLDLCLCTEAAAATSAALCIQKLVLSFPEQCAPWLLGSDSLGTAVAALAGDGTRPSPTLVQQYLLEALAQSLQIPNSVTSPMQDLRQLYATTQTIAASGEPSSGLAAEVLRTLAPFLQS